MIGIIPASANTAVDFPLPDRPTMPQELPPGIKKLISLKAGLTPHKAYDAVRS